MFYKCGGHGTLGPSGYAYAHKQQSTDVKVATISEGKMSILWKDMRCDGMCCERDQQIQTAIGCTFHYKDITGSISEKFWLLTPALH